MNAKADLERGAGLSFAAGLGAAVILASLACQVSLLLDHRALTRFGSGLAPIPPASAIGFLLCGVALACASFGRPAIQRLAVATAVLAASVGLVKVCGVFLPMAFRLESMPCADGWGLLLAGGALLLRCPGAKWRTFASQALAIAVGSAAMLALIGCIYGARHTLDRSSALLMAWPSVVLALLVATGVLSLDLSSAIMRGITAGSAGGVMARRLLPFVILTPVVFGDLGLHALRAGILDQELASALVTLAIILCFGAMVWAVGGTFVGIEEQQRRASESLEREREFLNVLLESFHDGVLACDERGNLSIFNRATRALHGLPGSATPPERWAARYDMYDVEGKAHLAMEDIPLYRAYQGERVHNEEMLIKSPRSGSRRVVCNGQAMFNSGGRKIGAVVVMSDVTERRRAEEALRKSEERLRTVIGKAPVVMWATDARGVFMFSDGSALHLLGLAPGQVVGHLIFDVFRGYAQFCDDHRSALAGTVVESAVEMKGVIFDTRLTPTFNDAGAVTGIIGVATDVTERRRAEEALRQANEQLEQRVLERTRDLAATNEHLQAEIAQRESAEENLLRAKQQAEQANEAKTEFLSRTSHELRTPLNAILGFAQVLEMDELPPAQATCVGHITRAGTHLLALVNDVLEISRIEAGCQSTPTLPVAVASVVSEAVDLVRAEAEGRGIEIIVEDSVDEACVVADRLRLKQVLINLVANAVKFNRDGGLVTIFCEPGATGDRHIHVRDTGMGIPREKVPRLFTPFDRLGAEQRGVAGTGLGLAASKRLVDAMGGSMNVNSTEGKGSTFTVTLPAAGTANAYSPNAMALNDPPDFAVA